MKPYIICAFSVPDMYRSQRDYSTMNVYTHNEKACERDGRLLQGQKKSSSPA